jgi:hypothetical protein
LAARPKGAHRNRCHCVAFLANILDIDCETRLVATVSVGSESYNMSNEAH